MTEEKILKGLKEAILTYDEGGAIKWAHIAIDEKVDPVKAIQVGLTPGILEIGHGFDEGILFLPNLVIAANVMKVATSILEKEIENRGIQGKTSLGKIVIGTVAGDIHDIGKTIVSTLLSAGGFNVIDLGTNVSEKEFLEVVKKENADILALSALLTTTVVEQRNVIQSLEEDGLRDNVKVIVGGGAVNEDHAKRIGADGYGDTASEAVNLAKELLNIA
jgi:trimethylamine corrinoid protein